mgnify:CR=1 FL=1
MSSKLNRGLDGNWEIKSAEHTRYSFLTLLCQYFKRFYDILTQNLGIINLEIVNQKY